jgi:CheY-like chemotaxis protein
MTLKMNIGSRLPSPSRGGCVDAGSSHGDDVNGSVLIVEDCAALADLEAELVVACQKIATVARDGSEALTRLSRESFDLVLLDLGLPKVAGQDVLDSLAVDGSLKRIPVIVVSGEIDRLQRTPQVVAVFSKPFLPDQLLSAIQFALAVTQEKVQCRQEYQWG